jgi:hypothetical protein
MSVVLSSDDLQPGLYCTVLRGRRQKLERRAAAGAAQPATRECYDYLKGVPLQVLHAEGPYLVAHVVSNGEPPRAILDLRDVELCRISREYVRAVTGKEYRTTL